MPEETNTGLTSRELLIAIHLATGDSTSQVARRLSMSPHTATAPPDPKRSELFDVLDVLRLAGDCVGALRTEHRAVLAALGEDEIAILKSVKARLEAATQPAEGEGREVRLR